MSDGTNNRETYARYYHYGLYADAKAQLGETPAPFSEWLEMERVFADATEEDVVREDEEVFGFLDDQRMIDATVASVRLLRSTDDINIAPAYLRGVGSVERIPVGVLTVLVDEGHGTEEIPLAVMYPHYMVGDNLPFTLVPRLGDEMVRVREDGTDVRVRPVDGEITA